MNDDVDTPSTEEDAEAAIARLEQEKQQLEHQLDRREERARRFRRGRGAIVGVAVFLASILFVLGTVGAWAHSLLLNPDHLTNTVAGLPGNPKVAAALSIKITDEVFAALDVEDRLRAELPPKVSIIAAPLTNAVHGFVQGRVQAVLQSPAFERAWRAVVHLSAERAVAILRGEHGTAVSIANGVVTLNLLPAINQALALVEQRASALLGKNVQLPTVSANDIPQEAIQRIEAALGVQLPDDFGQIVVFRSDALAAGQAAVRRFDRLVWVVAILAVLLIAVALLVSNRRRRTLIQLLAAIALGFVVVRNALRIAESQIVQLGKTAEGRAAIDVIVHQVLHGLFVLTAWLLGAAIVALVVALLTGPYGWATTFRRRSIEVGRAMSRSASPGRQPAAVAWIRSRYDVLQVGGVVVAVVLLLILHVSWVGLLVIVILAGLYELLLARIGRREPDDPSAPATDVADTAP